MPRTPRPRTLREQLVDAPDGAHLFALDSSIRSPGLSLWRKDGPPRPEPSANPWSWTLLWGRRVPQKGRVPEDVLQRAMVLAHQANLEANQEQGWVAAAFARKAYFCAEYPEIRGAGRGKGDSNSLLPMAAMLGATAVWLSIDADHCHALYPSEYLGGVPKTTSGDPRESVRGRRVWGLLTPKEREHLEVQHDAFDAAAMGLYLTGRCRVGIAPLRGHLHLDTNSSKLGK